jgi:hypothetical protein
MITLSNGDRWIIDDKEIEGISYEDAQAAKIPATDIREFVNRLVKGDWYLARKWVPEMGGFWDANFKANDEVLDSVSTAKVHTPFFQAYEMPWDEVLVVGRDSDGFKITVYENRAAFQKVVSF